MLCPNRDAPLPLRVHGNHPWREFSLERLRSFGQNNVSFERRGMARISNLRQARKDRERAEKKALADANAVRFGRTKAERLKQTTDQEQMRRRLDAQKFDDVEE